MSNPPLTRGYGLLERFLAKKRAQKANRLIQQSCRNGRILDIGSGAFPFFLLKTRFFEKYGIDKTFNTFSHAELTKHSTILIHHDIESEDPLPFSDEYFEVITMLAVFEHITPQRLPGFFQEVYRVLKRGGLLIITTPAEWTGLILKGMAIIGLLSAQEIKDHKRLHSVDSITNTLRQCGFASDRILFGYFELHMNSWVTAKK